MLALTFVFALPAFADGYILIGKTSTPPTADGYISIDKAGQPADSVTEMALSLLQSVLTLF